jgi:hypothetical protein
MVLHGRSVYLCFVIFLREFITLNYTKMPSTAPFPVARGFPLRCPLLNFKPLLVLVLIDVVDVRLVLVGGSSLLHNIDPKH